MSDKHASAKPHPEQQTASEPAQVLPEMDLGASFQKIVDATADELYSFAYHFYEHRKYEKAVHFFRTLMHFDQNNGDYWTGLAASLKMNKQYADAAAAYRVTIGLHPNDPLLCIYLADCCFAMGQIEEGLKAIDAAELAANGQPQHQKLISQLAFMRQAWCNSK